MLLFDVVTRVDKAIETKYALQPELKSFITNHERKSWFVNNLCRQILDMEKKMGLKFSAKHLDTMCSDFVGLFASQAIRHRDQQNLTESAKHKLRETKDYEGMEKDLIDRGILIPTAKEVAHKTIKPA